MSAGAPIWRASARASFANGTSRRVAGEEAARHGHAELDAGVSKVAAGPRQAGRLLGEAGGVGVRAGSNRDVCSGRADGLLDTPLWTGLAGVGLGGAAAPFRRRSHPRDWSRTVR